MFNIIFIFANNKIRRVNMPNLKCHQYSCKSNHCTHCSLPSISVSRDALCENYQRRTINDTENCDFEFSYEQGMSLKQDDHHINCSDTACVNNVSGQCSAGYIRIDKTSDGNEAKCCQVRERR